MQLEADALVRGERSGPDPRREAIAGGRLHGNVMADAREIDVGFSIKNQAQGTFARVLLLGIDADVHAGESFRKTPGKTAADNTRFESAVHKTEPGGLCRSARPAKRTAWSQTRLA